MATSARPVLPSLPLFDGLGTDGRLAWNVGNPGVREVMLNILLTRPGERLMRPDFGAGIRNYIHHPNNETTRALIADAAQRALQRWEPRVDVTEVRVVPDPERLSQVQLSVRYRLRQDGRADRLELTLELDA